MFLLSNAPFYGSGWIADAADIRSTIGSRRVLRGTQSPPPYPDDTAVVYPDQACGGLFLCRAGF